MQVIARSENGFGQLKLNYCVWL